jgi:hypothetical protein
VNGEINRTGVELPARLQRLNKELAVERIRDFDNDLYATRNGHRFRISVFRHHRFGFVATCKAAGHVHRYEGTLPSDAFTTLVHSLKYVVSRLDNERLAAQANEHNASGI